MSVEAASVYCGCGWRGRRVSRDCEYEDHIYDCSCVYGRCPRCQARVSTTSPAAWRRQQAAVDEWWEREGRTKYGTPTGGGDPP